MSNVFISYKTGDDNNIVKDLFDGLTERKNIFKGDIFLDKDGLRDAKYWESQLEQQLEKSDVLIVAIGEGWVSRSTELENEGDWVRREIITAKNGGKVIYPIILNDAKYDLDDIPSDLEFIFDTQIGNFITHEPGKLSVTINSLDQIADTLRDAPQKYKKDRMMVTANALVGVLNLVEKEMSNTERFSEAKEVMHRIIPVYFENIDDDITKIASKLIWESRDNVVLNDATYLQLIDESLNLRVAIIPSLQPVTVVLFEKKINKNESKLILVEYQFISRFHEFIDIESILQEPNLPDPQKFRTTYQSIFRCLIKSTTPNTRHQYLPKRDVNTMDSTMFSKMFKNEWIGSSNVSEEVVGEILNALTNEKPMKYTFIHAIEN
ncbi:MAG: hypothetical protein Phog2KO_40380 [Phototrophicaceae bacterium]